MPPRIAVCVKQVPDPDAPASTFKVDESARRVITAPGIPPVVNGFDLHATEAALRIKDAHAGGVEITVLSVGPSFVMEVIKKPLSMGADNLILVEDAALADVDAHATVTVLAAALKKAGPFDLILCGRQASDWDNAYVPLGLAEVLGLPCVTLARKVDLLKESGKVRVERSLTDGYQVVESDSPAVITVSNELGEPRYPTLRGIMAATRKQPSRWKPADIGLNAAALAPLLSLERLFVPERQKEIELIRGEDDADAGRKLALRLREAKLI
ncbi:MAG: electron transfer flavoprotein subunit beta/FixA family protein [Chloroflexi bacterium]|nr:electron transfer flavoprotein subunit beta/FixA family protein [Chloroflexota bacterium]